MFYIFFSYPVIYWTDGFARWEYSHNSVLAIQIPFSMTNKGAHWTASGPLMNRWQKVMLLSPDHPLNSGETAGANSASIPVEYYFSMHWFNYAWENWKQLQEEVAFFPPLIIWASDMLRDCTIHWQKWRIQSDLRT